jgi:hypothetical protein
MTTDFEQRERAKDLYVIEGMTLEQVAVETQIPVRTVEEWSRSDGWVEERREYRRSLSDIKRNTVTLRKRLISKALESLDPQDIYAASRLEALSARGEKKQESGEVAIDRPKLFLEDMGFIATTLKEIDPEGLKVFARNFESIVERFKSREQGAKSTEQRV